MLEIIKIGMFCGTLLVMTFVILMALPKSKLRSVVLEVAAWLCVAFAGIYIVSPIDLIPDVVPVAGWVDDGAALVAGIVAARTALSMRKEREKPQNRNPAYKCSEESSHQLFRGVDAALGHTGTEERHDTGRTAGEDRGDADAVGWP